MSFANTGAARAVLFDFDGTLADTAPDMAAALNRLLVKHGRAPVAVELARPYVSQGARGMLHAGFGMGADHDDYAVLRQAYLDEYASALYIDTVLFPGMEEVLQHLESNRIPWGIVTNKHSRYTMPLLAAMQLDRRPACIVCGDTCARAKPHPDPLLHAAEQMRLPPEACLYIGDDERDMLAAAAAGMRGIVASYGYLGTGKPPAEWPASAMIARPLDLLPLL